MEAEDGELEPRVDGELMLEALDPVMSTVGREPEDARIVVRDGKPRVVPAKVGVELDPQEIEDRFAEVAVLQGAERRLVVEGQATQPEFTTAEAKALKVTERVSTFTTNFPYAEYRNVNLTRARRARSTAPLLRARRDVQPQRDRGGAHQGERLHRGLHRLRRHLQEGPRRRRLADRDDDLQRDVLRRPQGRRAQAALGLHRPLPRGPGGDRGVAVAST